MLVFLDVLFSLLTFQLLCILIIELILLRLELACPVVDLLLHALKLQVANLWICDIRLACFRVKTYLILRHVLVLVMIERKLWRGVHGSSIRCFLLSRNHCLLLDHLQVHFHLVRVNLEYGTTLVIHVESSMTILIHWQGLVDSLAWVIIATFHDKWTGFIEIVLFYFISWIFIWQLILGHNDLRLG